MWPYTIERWPIHAPWPLNHNGDLVFPAKDQAAPAQLQPSLLKALPCVFREESFWIATDLPWALGQVSLSLCVLTCQRRLGIAHSLAMWQHILRLMSSSHECPGHSQVLQMADTVVTCVALGFPEAEPKTKEALCI